MNNDQLLKMMPEVIATIYDKLDRLQKQLLALGEKPSQKIKERLTFNQAVDYLNITTNRLRYYQYNGYIPYSKLGKAVMFRKVDLDEFIESNIIDIKANSKAVRQAIQDAQNRA